MRMQKSGQHIGKLRVTLDEVTGTNQNPPDARQARGNVISGRLEDNAVAAGHHQCRDMPG